MNYQWMANELSVKKVVLGQELQEKKYWLKENLFFKNGRSYMM